jgi:hypothetical protein
MEATMSYSIRETAVVTRHARNAFLGAMLICSILALYLTNVRDCSLGNLQSIHAVLGPLLLWSLTAAAYAFHALMRAYDRVSRRLDTLAARDHVRAERRISRVRQRLTSNDLNMRRLIEESKG